MTVQAWQEVLWNFGAIAGGLAWIAILLHIGKKNKHN